MFSCQLASQVTLSSCCTRPQACPGCGQMGTLDPGPMFTVTCATMDSSWKIYQNATPPLLLLLPTPSPPTTINKSQ